DQKHTQMILHDILNKNPDKLISQVAAYLEENKQLGLYKHFLTPAIMEKLPCDKYADFLRLLIKNHFYKEVNSLLPTELVDLTKLINHQKHIPNQGPSQTLTESLVFSMHYLTETSEPAELLNKFLKSGSH